MHVYVYVYMYVHMYICCSNQTTGGWSNNSITQDNDNKPPVLCNTTHLTSFSVLVSYKMEKSSEVCNHKHLHTFQL